MLRSRLPNIFLKEKYLESKKAYNKNHNIYVSMVKKLRTNAFKILTYQVLLTTRSCTTVSPLFGNREKNNHKIDLIEKNVLVTSDEEIAKTFKEYFAEIVLKLNIIQNECHIRKTANIVDPVKKASLKYQYHSSMTNIKDTMKSKNIFSFSFQPDLIDKVKEIIKLLNTKNACPDGDIYL